jgi:hypothetical protein
VTQEKVLSCVSCGNSYTLTAGEMSFYTSKQWNLPKRCAACRAERRAQRAAAAQAITYDVALAVREVK